MPIRRSSTSLSKGLLNMSCIWRRRNQVSQMIFLLIWTNSSNRSWPRRPKMTTSSSHPCSPKKSKADLLSYLLIKSLWTITFKYYSIFLGWNENFQLTLTLVPHLDISWRHLKGHRYSLAAWSNRSKIWSYPWCGLWYIIYRLSSNRWHTWQSGLIFEPCLSFLAGCIAQLSYRRHTLLSL